MKLQCPCCDALFNIEEGFTAIDGKKLAALLASVEPSLGKTIIAYLNLFSAPKRGLKMAKAIKLVEDLMALVNAGTVTRDARSNDIKKATTPMWVAGIEQMLESRNKLTIPLNNHNYLRAIVWSIANDPSQVLTVLPKKAQATPVNRNEEYSKIIGSLRLGLISNEEAEQKIKELKGA